MESVLKQTGRGLVLEIELPTTGIDRVQAARLALERHMLKAGQVQVEFLNPTTWEVRE